MNIIERQIFPKPIMLCGPDGIRTRDLGLDRAACLAATPRDQFLSKQAGRSLPCALVSVNTPSHDKARDLLALTRMDHGHKHNHLHAPN